MSNFKPALARVFSKVHFSASTPQQHAEDLGLLVEALRSEALAKSDQKVLALEQKARDLAVFVETSRQQMLAQTDRKAAALEAKARDLSKLVATLRHQAAAAGQAEIDGVQQQAFDLALSMEAVRTQTRAELDSEISEMAQRARDLTESVEVVREIAMLQSEAAIELLVRSHEKTVALNEALLLAARRQQELSEASDQLNAKLLVQIAVRKQAEDAAQHSEERLRRALESAELGSWNIDYRTQTFSADERFRAFYGVADSVLTYQQCSEIVHPDDRARVSGLVAAATQPNDPVPYEAEYRVVHADQSVHWLYAKGRAHFDEVATGKRLASFDGTLADVTQRKQAESALQETQERYRNLFNSMDEGYCTIQMIFNEAGEPTDWLFLEVNPSFAEQTGLQNATGKRMLEIAPDHERYWFETYGRVALTGEATRFVNQAGALAGRWFDLYAFRIGQPEEFKVAVLFRDIIERRRAERQLAEQAEALVDLHRRKDEFLAMLSHELRNPLAPISNAVHLLALDPNPNPTQQLARGIIERQVKQLKHLIDDLLEVSRITSGRVQLRLEPVLLDRIVERALETSQPLIAQRRHHLQLSMPKVPLALHADAARLEQVVVNLLTNAAKYTDEGGQIWLEVGVEAQEALLSVRDTGVGIAPELLPKIFDLFTQADRSLDRSQGGLGIGLCLVQRLVQLHGGSVQAYSSIGKGSEFVVRLPLLAATAQPVAVVYPEAILRTAERRRVLVVDDNIDAAQSLASLLKSVGHDVHTAHDGPMALETAFALQPEVILLDIGLPGLNGLEVAKEIRQRADLPQPLLVALTGYGQESDRALSQSAGFDHHLVKPAEFRAVQRILADAFGEA